MNIVINRRLYKKYIYVVGGQLIMFKFRILIGSIKRHWHFCISVTAQTCYETCRVFQPFVGGESVTSLEECTSAVFLTFCSWLISSFVVVACCTFSECMFVLHLKSFLLLITMGEKKASVQNKARENIGSRTKVPRLLHRSTRILTENMVVLSKRWAAISASSSVSYDINEK